MFSTYNVNIRLCHFTFNMIYFLKMIFEDLYIEMFFFSNDVWVMGILLFFSGDGKFSLESEIRSSIRSTSKFPPQQKSSILDRHSSDSDELDMAISSQSNSNFKNTFQTFKIGTANKMHIGGMCSDSPIPIYNPGICTSLLFEKKNFNLSKK